MMMESKLWQESAERLIEQRWLANKNDRWWQEMPDSSNRTRRKKKRTKSVGDIVAVRQSESELCCWWSEKISTDDTSCFNIPILIDESEIHLDTHRTLSSRTKTTYLFCLNRTTQEPKQAR